MDWFTQHLYHNTDRMVQFAKFPINDKLSNLKVVDVNDGDGEYNVIGRIQNMYDMSLKQTYEALREQIWSTLRGDTKLDVSEILDHDVNSSYRLRHALSLGSHKC
ncbi:hypothetical protein THRCLA_21010 [Thraustotheca clavata]|uniref:Uncharacterized protein n=1 Tax=Thraustotheca clavata TaxID=74557 RepID=A0A1W0A130_9STRA|nr:hypothetical protein THRCLA_21010 [Thraustotheca clavata]